MSLADDVRECRKTTMSTQPDRKSRRQSQFVQETCTALSTTKIDIHWFVLH